MKWLLLLTVVLGVCGCDKKAASTKPDDPNIKAERTIVQPGGGAYVGPFGGGYEHGKKVEKYEGPASKAPAWAK
jgi:hypothetical protein